jgi:hypothetical protein
VFINDGTGLEWREVGNETQKSYFFKKLGSGMVFLFLQIRPNRIAAIDGMR